MHACIRAHVPACALMCAHEGRLAGCHLPHPQSATHLCAAAVLRALPCCTPTKPPRCKSALGAMLAAAQGRRFRTKSLPPASTLAPAQKQGGRGTGAGADASSRPPPTPTCCALQHPWPRLIHTQPSPNRSFVAQHGRSQEAQPTKHPRSLAQHGRAARRPNQPSIQAHRYKTVVATGTRQWWLTGTRQWWPGGPNVAAAARRPPQLRHPGRHCCRRCRSHCCCRHCCSTARPRCPL